MTTRPTPLFPAVLVANRGEIARRIIRTLRELGIRSVAVFSDADAEAPHVCEADEAVRIGPAPAADSYLRVDAIVRAALRTGAAAIHPGYGFLSESVALAQACAESGLTFIGPGIAALEIMGDKARARDHVAASGVPVVPGFSAIGLADAEIGTRAAALGFPVLIKPSAGGGGKGMETVDAPERLPAALASARRVASGAFGDDSLVIERLIERPRHIEVQVFGDATGRVIALGERECTLQRRHQKVVEEAPAPGLSDAVRERLHAAAVRAAQSVDYLGAGTVEFLVDAAVPDDFFFIEMNTRLQVEHPVTELVIGWDLVAEQLRVAAGGPLPAAPPVPSGHAVEARVYAESPADGFLPQTGRVLRFAPAPGVRTDAAVQTGSEVTGFYDPMIAKVIAHGPDRSTALARLDAALGETVVLGVTTNISFLHDLLAVPEVRAGELDTGIIAAMPPYEPPPVSAAALDASRRVFEDEDRGRRGGGPAGESSRRAGATWVSERGWRLAGRAEEPAMLLEDEQGRIHAVAEHAGAHDADQAVAAADGAGGVWVHAAGATHRLRRVSRLEAMIRRLAAQHPVPAEAKPEARAPMPGSVVAMHVTDGERVRAGEPIVSIEAMKMEHPVLAPCDGTVLLTVVVGEQVTRDQIVARIEREEQT